ncbi:hypothetical protein K466DRAFT_230470 [Polyporus arcularius HHB13444]|uniref:BTB domain-containing protein n=1 Tax=Polyporus arcularius HHB13444 TaxID=1314778 RepID=A0A5C3P4V3_9APHY|nr:hypothetical protein K466DRAFT_230470 [Polyporus arcularius HHB13444]
MATTTLANVERDTTFWFYDANIILIAQGDVAFRVHESVLALHSEVFAGMFQQSLSVSQGLDDERIDGCPIVLLDDTAYDILQLLLVIYGFNRLKTPEETTFPILAALTRAGDKYVVTGVHDIVNECALLLISMVPATLDDYEKASNSRSALEFESHHAVEALHVFRLIDLGADALRTHSFILYLCAQLDEDELRNGTARADGTPEMLSDADLDRVLALKRELQRRGKQAVHDARYDFKGPEENCERYDEDGNMVERGLEECDIGYDESVVNCITQRVRDGYGRGELFNPRLLDTMHDALRRDLVCYSCMKPKLRKQVQLREDAWDALPVLAGMVE